MLKYILMLAVLVGFGAAAQAQVTINANGLSPNFVLAANGTTLAVGDLVRIGYFSNTSILATDNSFTDLSNTFTPIGEGIAAGTPATSGTLSESNNATQTMDINNAGGVTGQFAGGFNGVSSGYLPPGALLYMWVFNSTSGATATQWGIFQAPAAWVFPANLGTTTMTLTPQSGVNISAIRGSTSGSGSNISYELDNIATVPEPSTFAFVLSGMLVGVMALRRRR